MDGYIGVSESVAYMTEGNGTAHRVHHAHKETACVNLNESNSGSGLGNGTCICACSDDQ